jgi:hypothetical protein
VKRIHKDILEALRRGAFLSAPRGIESSFSLRGPNCVFIRDVRSSTVREMRQLGLLDSQLQPAPDATGNEK